MLDIHGIGLGVTPQIMMSASHAHINLLVMVTLPDQQRNADLVG